MNQFWLTKEQVIELTGRVRPHAQKKQLEALGYQYRLRADGTFVVPVDQFMPGGANLSVTGEAKLNLSALDHAA